MHSEEGSEAGKSCENGEAAPLDALDVPDASVSQKYRELKTRLKYLIYVSELANCPQNYTFSAWFVV